MGRIGFAGFFPPNQIPLRHEAGRSIRRPFLKGLGSREGEERTVSVETGTALSYSFADFWCLAPFLEEKRGKGTETEGEVHMKMEADTSYAVISQGRPSIASSYDKWGGGKEWVPPQSLQKVLMLLTLILDFWLLEL